MLPCPHPLIWRCNINSKHIVKIMQFSIAREIWLAWSKFNFEIPVAYPDILQQVLWFSSAILKNKLPYIDMGMYHGGILTVSNAFLQDEKRFLTFQEISNMVNCADPIGYQSLIIGGSGGRRVRRTPPPMGPNSFIFAYIFTEKHLCQRSMPPQWVHTPLQEILDLPLLILNIPKKWKEVLTLSIQ